jgi:quercetin dioxygenase-like cupin family protein
VGDEPEKTYKVGEMFIETPNQLHAVSRNASDTKPAKLLAVMLSEKGTPRTAPEK